MEDTLTPQYAMELGDYVEILRRRRAPFYITFILVLTLALVIAYVLPPVYRSEATILIEKQEIPHDLVATTVTGYVQERIVGIKQSLVTYDNLIEIAEKLNLFPEMREEGDISNMVAKIRQSIFVDMVNVQASDSRKPGQAIATVSFTVAYEADDPGTAQKVAAELADRYLEENKLARSKQTAEVTAFLQEEANVLLKDIEKQEKALAHFKQEQREKLPELMDVNLKLYEKTEEKIESSKEHILSLQDKIMALSAELSLTDPRKAVRTDEGKTIQSPSERLNALTAEYLQASSRYSQSHPDVIKLRREIKTLGGQSKSAAEAGRLVSKLMVLRTDMQTAKQKYSDEHPDVRRLEASVSSLEAKLRNLVVVDQSRSTYKGVAPDNPRYVALKTQLESLRSNLVQEKTKLATYNTKLVEYEKRLFQTPVVERDYKSLSRDYANARAKYEDLRSKILKARLAEQLEAGDKAERFVLTGSAYFPTSPDKPNRLGIVLLGILMAFGGGLGSVSMAEYRDNTVRGQRGVAQSFGALPIAIIPYIENSADKRQKLLRRIKKIVVLVAFIAIVLAIVHMYLKPLDGVWEQIMGNPVEVVKDDDK